MGNTSSNDVVRDISITAGEEETIGMASEPEHKQSIIHPDIPITEGEEVPIGVASEPEHKQAIIHPDISITEGEEVPIGVASEPEHKQAIIHSQQPQGKSSMVLPQYQFVLKDSDMAIDDDRRTEENLYQILRDGVYLNQKKKKFWLDEKGNKNCFMLYARDIAITWGDTSSYWRWIYLKDAPREDLIEVAELVNVCWLEANVRFDTLALSPQTTYRVVLVVMIRANGYGWHVPVNFKLVLPDGSCQEHQEMLDEKPREQWFEILVGEIRTTGEDTMTSGKMEISMYEIKGGNWKSGMVIKGVVIRPKD
ncbi:hypothetical protein MLD38_021256 [Melastoma candidum]|uniref:Uncharacterized protein n=1 Tax=Melastoma candidum TaxID=119954 RepID=A0ACB9QIF1_9MYRT|nr:hypothetical protein MLD38_021256 [Melastoma candidum]